MNNGHSEIRSRPGWITKSNCVAYCFRFFKFCGVRCRSNRLLVWCGSIVNPTAASIKRVLDQQGESGTLVLYPEAGFKRVLAKGTTRWVKELDRLAESALGSLSLGDNETLAKLFRSANRFADQLILSTPAGPPGRGNSGLVTDAFSPWSSLVSRLVRQSRFEKTQPIRLSSDAAELLRAVREGKSVLIASKVALHLRGCSLGSDGEISGQVMEDAIAIGGALVQRSDEAAKRILMLQTERDAALMLRKIQKRGPIRKRTLRRSYRRQSVELHAEPIQVLIQSGKVRERADKRLEATFSPSVDPQSATGS